MKLPVLSYHARLVVTALFACMVFDAIIWHSVFATFTSKTKLYFLNVGQGDSQLMVLPGGKFERPITILSDAGPDGKVINELTKALSQTDTYIDLLVVSHPQADHMNGFIEVMKKYEVGALIFNGRAGTAQSWKEFEDVARERHVPVVVAREGDSVKYAANSLRFLAPNGRNIKSKELNDTMLVGLLASNNATALFAGDIDSKIEDELIKKYDLDVDILKVGHHGSKYSSGEKFLKATSPKVAFIQVGKNNYGHPTKEALSRLAAVGARVYRNDKNGMVTVTIDGKYIGIEKER